MCFIIIISVAFAFNMEKFRIYASVFAITNIMRLNGNKWSSSMLSRQSHKWSKLYNDTKSLSHKHQPLCANKWNCGVSIMCSNGNMGQDEQAVILKDVPKMIAHLYVQFIFSFHIYALWMRLALLPWSIKWNESCVCLRANKMECVYFSDQKHSSVAFITMCIHNSH